MTLYKHSDVCQRIETLRTMVQQLPSSRDLKQNMSDTSKDDIIASLKRKIHRLEEANSKLRTLNKARLAGEWDKL